jgi:hypothetical protein
VNPIINVQSVTPAVMFENLSKVPCTSWFYRATEALSVAALQSGVDPVVAVAQCALETGWGHFGGSVTEAHGNTCGMKNVDATGDTAADLAHFAIDPDTGYPVVGAMAHVQHLSLYAGVVPKTIIVDPRAKYIWTGTAAFGSAPFVENLGGKWAPNSEYGNSVVKIINRLKGL